MSNQLFLNSTTLLKNLIRTMSYSGEENNTADIIEKWFENNKIKSFRNKNNVWAKNKFFDNKKPTILLKISPRLNPPKARSSSGDTL